jgi:hypothetical protein
MRLAATSAQVRAKRHTSGDPAEGFSVRDEAQGLLPRLHHRWDGAHSRQIASGSTKGLGWVA